VTHSLTHIHTLYLTHPEGGERQREREREGRRETGQDIVRGGVAEKILVTEHTSCQHLCLLHV
jgi:hypothetical protein